MKTKGTGLGYDPKALAKDIGSLEKTADAAMKAADAIDPKTYDVKKTIDAAAEAELGERPGMVSEFFSLKWMTGDDYASKRLAAVERIRKRKKAVYDAAVDIALQLDELKGALDKIVGRSAWPVELALSSDRGAVSERLAVTRQNALKEIAAVREMLSGAKGSAGAVQFPTDRLDRVQAALERDLEILDDVKRSPRGSDVLADAVTTLAETDPHEAVGPKIFENGKFVAAKYVLEIEAAHLARTEQTPSSIPLALSTRPPDKGAVFLLEIPAKVRSLEAAVHLPPGYDSTKGIAHPVLIVAGGKKFETDQWLDREKLDQHLDTSAKANQPAPITIVLREMPTFGLDEVLTKHVPAFVESEFGADPKRVGLAAIGMDGMDVAKAAAKVASKLETVSIHEGIGGGEDFAGLVRALEGKGKIPSPGRASQIDLSGLKDTNVFVTGGKSDGHELLALSRNLEASGVRHDTAVFDGGNAVDWLGYHGAKLNGGDDNVTKTPNVTKKLEAERASGLKGLGDVYAAAKRRVRSKIDSTLKELDAAASEIKSAKLPTAIKSVLENDVASKRAPHETRLAQLDALPSIERPHAAVTALLELEAQVRGAGPIPVSAIVAAWKSIPAADQKRLNALIGGDEHAAAALAAMMMAKPKWLVETEPKRKSKFIDQLETRIARGFLETGDLGQFLTDAVKAGDPWLDAFETKRQGPERWDGKKFVATSYIEEAQPDGTPKAPLIPPTMQKQSATEGSFFIRLIRSRALSKDLRAGVYLPPGYDPNGDEKYPVLVMLPGKGGKVETWLEKGGLKEHLDQQMRGDGQKMIVIVPDGNDSYYVNQEKKKQGLGDMKVAEGDFGDMVMKDVLPHATNTLNGDAKRLSILGLSRGGYGALALSMMHSGRFRSVSVHGAVIPGALKGKKGDEFDEARTTASVPSHWQTNPTDLVGEGAWKTKAPAVLVSVGAADQHVLSNAIDFGTALEDADVPHHLHVLDIKGETAADHSWEVFGPTVREAIDFHQGAHTKGAKRKPKIPKGFEAVQDFDAALKAVEEAKKKAAEEAKKKSPFRTKFPWED